MASPSRCWTAATPGSPPKNTIVYSGTLYPTGSVPGKALKRYLSVSM